MPCRNTEHLDIDLKWLLFYMANARGLSGPATIDELSTPNDQELMQDLQVSKEAVFLAKKKDGSPGLDPNNPLRSASFNEPLQLAAKNAGIAVYVTMNCFRREFTTKLTEAEGVEDAKMWATRESACNKAIRHSNARGLVLNKPGNIRIAESCSIRMQLGSAAVNRRTPPMQMEKRLE
ncbi:hypothetical protein K461DRAFT_324232 [Myriangium duriaei CBS 260.36]|uniref:Uncharacterized protein n=1 Tax=Myriangium duriaei CBS 260.36 TaxID=1168546 RepID=A0A9P4MGA7_9PEZI|nr:hypothetical protein K461DRAFT_324232 [Myriangium duriaei CBS 260.36]